MKIYEAYNKKNIAIPEIKIKNQKLVKSGFLIGKQFNIIYEKNKIVLEIIQKKTII